MQLYSWKMYKKLQHLHRILQVWWLYQDNMSQLRIMWRPNMIYIYSKLVTFTELLGTLYYFRWYKQSHYLHYRCSHCCDCRRPSISGNWKTNTESQTVLEEIPVLERYRLWIDKVLSRHLNCLNFYCLFRNWFTKNIIIFDICKFSAHLMETHQSKIQT